MSTLVVVGGGRMGAALVGGLVTAGAYKPSEITVVDPSHAALDAVRRYDVETAASPVAADGAILAVKPSELERACRQLATVDVGRVLSIVAGATTAAIESYLGAGTRVVRSMPNTPALIGAGASAIAGGASATAEDLEWAESILSAVGTVVRVPEHLIDAVTGLSGSGPAYVFLIAEALTEAGVLAGLDRATAAVLATETLRGSAELLAQSGASPAELRAQVTSPGGTTAAGLRVLEQRGVRAALLDAVAAATERARELGGGK
jgi:pyrroline-5-carboxylate reductase